MAIELRPIGAAAPETIERLLDAVFGTERLARTAYRLRAAAAPIERLSMTAFRSEVLAGSLQCWPLALEGAGSGATRALVMVGPVAVDPALQGTGVGKSMLAEAARRLDAVGHAAMLIGDEPYYGPFGFRARPASGWTLPGPADPERVLLRALPSEDWPVSGKLVAAPFAFDGARA